MRRTGNNVKEPDIEFADIVKQVLASPFRMVKRVRQLSVNVWRGNLSFNDTTTTIEMLEKPDDRG